MRSGLITVLRTVRFDRGSHGSHFFFHRVVFEAKKIEKIERFEVFPVGPYGPVWDSKPCYRPAHDINFVLFWERKA